MNIGTEEITREDILIKYPIGTKFFNFTTIGPPYYTMKQHARRVVREVYIECKCKCGEIRHIRCRDMGKLNRQSCGCKQKEIVSNALRKGTLVNELGYKVCTMCQKEKHISAYIPNKKTKDRLRQFCDDCSKDFQLKRAYGISLEEYRKILQRQNARCGCCGSQSPKCPQKIKKTKENYFVVDHCHQTGKVRGLLCFNCNTAIGKLDDSIEGVKRALKYLEDFHNQLDIEDKTGYTTKVNNEITKDKEDDCSGTEVSS